MTFGNKCEKQPGVRCKRGLEAPNEETASLVCGSILPLKHEAWHQNPIPSAANTAQLVS
jgi:hypothetical protein